MKPLELYCATGNAGKVREFQDAAPSEIHIVATGPRNCAETGTKFAEIALEKALCYSRALLAEGVVDPLLFADDSGLEVDFLDGAPGVRSARFSGPDATDEANNALLLERLSGVPKPRRTARFVCAIALVRGLEPLAQFRGETRGRILEAPRGTGGFGYDPLFLSLEAGRTFAELTTDQKRRLSHRGHAAQALFRWLEARAAK